jgi:hypothetical protein
VLAPTAGAGAGITDSSYCNGVAVPAVAIISISNGRAIPPVDGTKEAKPLLSLSGTDCDEPSRTFIGCCPLPLSPVPSTVEVALRKNTMLWNVTPR